MIKVEDYILREQSTFAFWVKAHFNQKSTTIFFSAKKKALRKLSFKKIFLGLQNIF